jgi:hypothetical protein
MRLINKVRSVSQSENTFLHLHKRLFVVEKLKYLVICYFSLICLCSCANPPSKIPASYISHERYSDLTCKELAEVKAVEIDKLKKACHAQKGCVAGDCLGVFLVGIPFSAIAGDHEAEIAEYKGIVTAIETEQIINKCSFTPVKVLMEQQCECVSDEENDEYGSEYD